MTIELFIQLLSQLSAPQWQSIVDGKNINMMSDQQLIISTENSNSIIENKDIPTTHLRDVRAYIIENFCELLMVVKPEKKAASCGLFLHSTKVYFKSNLLIRLTNSAESLIEAPPVSAA